MNNENSVALGIDLFDEADKIWQQNVKDEMLNRGLNIKDVKTVLSTESENMSFLVDLKNNLVILERTFEMKDLQVSIVMKRVERKIEPKFYKNIIKIEKPRLVWQKYDNRSWFVSFNSEYNIVEISHSADVHPKGWKIDIIGVSSENFNEFDLGLEDLEAVKKLAEAKTFEAVEKIVDIINRSV